MVPFRRSSGAALAMFVTLGIAGAASLGTRDVAEYPSCSHCGMDRTRWSHTRHRVEYSDGHVEATCSLRCAAQSLDDNWGRRVQGVSAADAGSPDDLEPLWPVDELVYVLDPTQPGTMAPRRKWAYRDRAAAEAMARKLEASGGRLLTFDQALLATFEDVVEQASEERRRPAGRGRRRR